MSKPAGTSTVRKATVRSKNPWDDDGQQVPSLPVTVEVTGASASTQLTFVRDLVKVLNTCCLARAGFDGADQTADVVVLPRISGAAAGRCMVHIHVGERGEGDIPADITVLDPSHPDAAGRAAEALAQLPVVAVVPGLWKLPAVGAIHCIREDTYPDPETVFAEVYGSSSHCVWLDSSNASTEQPSGRNRYSIMADDGGTSGRRISHLNGLTLMESPLVSVRVPGPFFSWLERNWPCSQRPVPGLPTGLEFALGWLGYLGYELKRECGGKSVDSPMPDAVLIHPSRAIVFDHKERCLYILAEGGDEGQQWCASTIHRLRTLRHESSGTEDQSPPVNFEASDSAASYVGKILASQNEISDGNSYEICLTTQLYSTCHDRIDPWQLYRHLRRASPAPFASFLRLGSVALASSSPERFLGIASSGRLRAEPIKGTRRRGSVAEEDDRLRADLLHSRKDRAENIMIVDLLRNDLSRHAEPGSVAVTRLCDVESYASVHQMVSTIEARVSDSASRAQVVAAAYPPGSMTGAPKISSMDILDRLESQPRGPYSGVIGYFSPNGAADLSVTIRCVVLADGPGGIQHVSVGVGGAITADSIASKELHEIRIKASAILNVLGSSFPNGQSGS